MQKPIIIFDSGIGGLSVYQEVIKKLPHVPVVYCSDNQGFPYGSKSEEDVVERTLCCLNKLAEQFEPSLVVIACNTASTISLPRARRELNIPVVGVVPAIKPAGVASKKRCIGLLATPGTVQREYTHQLIRDFANHCEVVCVGSSELVYLAEQHLRGKSIDQNILINAVEPFFNRPLTPDCIVLGCTHFPLLQEQLAEIVPEPVLWIDSGEAIARRVESLLKENPEETSQDLEITSKCFIYTGSGESIEDLKPALSTMGFDQIRPL